MEQLLSAFFRACSTPDGACTNGLSLCDYYERMEAVETARREACGQADDEIENQVMNYAAASEEQGFCNGVRYGLALAREGWGR